MWISKDEFDRLTQDYNLDRVAGRINDLTVWPIELDIDQQKELQLVAFWLAQEAAGLQRKAAKLEEEWGALFSAAEAARMYRQDIIDEEPEATIAEAALALDDLLECAGMPVTDE